MLIRQDGREPDHDEPGDDSDAQNNAAAPRVNAAEDDEHRDVQRRKQIVRLVEKLKPIESGAEPAARVDAWEGEVEGKRQENNCRDAKRRDQSFRKRVHLSLAPTKERRDDEEKVDRHVGNDHQGNERNGALPGEEKCQDVVALRRDPIAPAIDDEKKENEQRGSAERFAAQAGLSRIKNARMLHYSFRPAIRPP